MKIVTHFIQLLLIYLALLGFGVNSSETCEPILSEPEDGFQAKFFQYIYPDFAYEYSDSDFIDYGYSRDDRYLGTVNGVQDVNIYHFYNLNPDGPTYGQVNGFNISISNYSVEYTGWFVPQETGNHTFQIGQTDDGTKITLITESNSLCCCKDDSSMFVQALKIYDDTTIQTLVLELIAGVPHPIKIVYFNKQTINIQTVSFIDPSGIAHFTFDGFVKYYNQVQCATQETCGSSSDISPSLSSFTLPTDSSFTSPFISSTESSFMTSSGSFELSDSFSSSITIPGPPSSTVSSSAMSHDTLSSTETSDPLSDSLSSDKLSSTVPSNSQSLISSYPLFSEFSSDPQLSMTSSASLSNSGLSIISSDPLMSVTMSSMDLPSDISSSMISSSIPSSSESSLFSSLGLSSKLQSVIVSSDPHLSNTISDSSSISSSTVSSSTIFSDPKLSATSFDPLFSSSFSVLSSRTPSPIQPSSTIYSDLSSLISISDLFSTIGSSDMILPTTSYERSLSIMSLKSTEHNVSSYSPTPIISSSLPSCVITSDHPSSMTSLDMSSSMVSSESSIFFVSSSIHSSGSDSSVLFGHLSSPSNLLTPSVRSSSESSLDSNFVTSTMYSSSYDQPSGSVTLSNKISSFSDPYTSIIKASTSYMIHEPSSNLTVISSYKTISLPLPSIDSSTTLNLTTKTSTVSNLNTIFSSNIIISDKPTYTTNIHSTNVQETNITDSRFSSVEESVSEITNGKTSTTSRLKSDQTETVLQSITEVPSPFKSSSLTLQMITSHSEHLTSSNVSFTGWETKYSKTPSLLTSVPRESKSGTIFTITIESLDNGKESVNSNVIIPKTDTKDNIFITDTFKITTDTSSTNSTKISIYTIYTSNVILATPDSPNNSIYGSEVHNGNSPSRLMINSNAGTINDITVGKVIIFLSFSFAWF